VRRVNIAIYLITKHKYKMDFKKIAIGFVVAAAGTLVALFVWSKVQEHKLKKATEAKKETVPAKV
jgi:hypothetical protein